MAHDITEDALDRHTVKAYDSSRRISDSDVEKIKTLLRFSPSSINLQPWHFILASTDEGKNRIAKAGTDDKYPFNSDSIRNASHVVVFAGRLDADELYKERLLEQEEEDGRFGGQEDRKEQMRGARTMFVNLHKQDMKDLQHWMDKQVYWNGGQFLLGASALGIDATPMEGIDPKGLDDEFGLREKGYSSLFVVCLGYLDPKEDYNADLPKSRLPLSETLTEV